MNTPPRTQRAYDHRLKDLVRETGDIRLATNQDVPVSTARGWLRRPRKDVLTLDVLDMQEKMLRREVLVLRRRNRKLAAILRLLMVLVRVSGFSLCSGRVPDGNRKSHAPEGDRVVAKHPSR